MVKAAVIDHQIKNPLAKRERKGLSDHECHVFPSKRPRARGRKGQCPLDGPPLIIQADRPKAARRQEERMPPLAAAEVQNAGGRPLPGKPPREFDDRARGTGHRPSMLPGRIGLLKIAPLSSVNPHDRETLSRNFSPFNEPPPPFFLGGLLGPPRREPPP